MGDRYFITGVQLGMIKAILKANGQPYGFINDIAKKQFIGRIEEEEEDNHEIKIVRNR